MQRILLVQYNSATIKSMYQYAYKWRNICSLILNLYEIFAHYLINKFLYNISSNPKG